MKPIIIVQRGTMTPADLKLLNDNGICTVEADDPSKVKFVDPIPAVSSRTEVENAAIELSRRVLSGAWNAPPSGPTRGTFANIYVEALIAGTKLDPRGSKEEQLKKIFDEEKESEIRKLAREEAKEERRLAKEAKASAKAKPRPNPAPSN